MKKLNWLHLSDFHCGQKSQWMWNNFKNVFLNDLRHISNELGRVDLVIFSGDLTQSGTTEEYELLNTQLKEIWGVLAETNSVPPIFHVPGNHDLTRPDPKDARVKMLSHWNNDPDVAIEFWKKTQPNQYLEIVNNAFINYVNWAKDLNKLGIPLIPTTKGLLPGDYSSSIDIDGISVGLVGLNSSFLHLGDKSKGTLELSLHQLNAVTEGDPANWVNKHQINFLVTHHPPDWLSDAAHGDYQTEIAPTGRFTAHMFGHMHEPEIVEIKRGGSKGRRFVQAASLFGLEYLNDEKTERIHGYSAGQISISQDHSFLRIWPRISIVSKRSKDRKISPDHENFDLILGKEYLEEKLTDLGQNGQTLVPADRKVEIQLTLEVDPAAWKEALNTTRHILQEEAAHMSIRLLQQRVCIDWVKKNRLAWIAADWGLGSDGFLWSVLKGAAIESLPTFRISLRDYSDRDSFITQFGIDVGCSFAEYTNSLTAIGRAILILEEAPVSSLDQQKKKTELDVIKLTEMILDFCPQLTLIVLSRTKPATSFIQSVVLEPLDEPDTRSYLLSHPNLAPSTVSKNGVSLIFRRTGGLPGKIDSTLRTLRVLSLAELSNETAHDPESVTISGESVPFTLIQVIDEISSSTDTVIARAYFLLKVLSILPHGETIERLKRVDATMPIFSKHAEELLDRNLIQVRSSTISLAVDSPSDDRMRIIFAPQQVADYVLSRMEKNEINLLVKKSIVLYFGQKWKENKTPLEKLSGVLVSDEGTLVANPHSLVLRLLADEATWTNSQTPVPIFNLCTVYTAALIKGEHYRSAVVACREILAANDNRYSGVNIGEIQFTLARALRMVGEYNEALDILTVLVNNSGSKQHRGHILLALALTQNRLDHPDTLATANSVINLVPDSEHAVQAKAIILELEEDQSNKKSLIALEKDARKRGFNVAANNLALGRVASDIDSHAGLNFDVLQEVYNSAIAANDKYTSARAIAKIGDLLLKSSLPLHINQVHSLITAYEYLYGERFKVIFDSVHESLWKYFEQRNDVPNLLSLFRHSSLIWRLDDNEKKERQYSEKLINSAKQILGVDLLNTDKDTAYFLLRAAKLTKGVDDQ